MHLIAVCLLFGPALVTVDAKPGAVSSSRDAPAATFSLGGSASAIAVDGPDVAVSVEALNRYQLGGIIICGAVVLWDSASGRSVPATFTTCDNEGEGQYDRITSVAISGDRAVWINQRSSLSSWWALHAESFTDATARIVLHAEGANVWDYAQAGSGEHGVVAAGGGATLEVRTFVAERVGITRVYFSRIKANAGRVGASSIHFLFARRGWCRVLAVHRNRVAIAESGGRLEVASLRGRTLRLFHVAHARELRAAFDRDQLAVADGATLATYNVATGTRVSLRLQRGLRIARFAGFARGLAAWVHGRNIRLLRVADGAHADVPITGEGPVLARLSAAGLFYTSRPSPGTPSQLVYLSARQLAQALNGH